MLLTTLVCWVIGDNLKETPMPEFYTKSHSVNLWRDTLCQASRWMWGGLENKDWYIVQDQTVIGFHARSNEGEVIELR